MTKPWGLYVYPMEGEGEPQFMEVPRDEWNERFGWQSGSCSRIVERPYVTEDREIQLVTTLCAEDLEGRLHLEKPGANPWVYGFPPAVPFLRGNVVVASYLQEGGGRELPLNVATLYRKTGIEAIRTKPSLLLQSERIPCNMNYLKHKVAELRNMPSEE